MHGKLDNYPVGKNAPLGSRKSQNIVKENAKKIVKGPVGLKYAIAWIAYVLLGSWLFLILETTTTEIATETDTWVQFKNLYMSRDEADEFENVKSRLSKQCSHELFKQPFERPVTGSAFIIDNKYSDGAANHSDYKGTLVNETFEEVERICRNSVFLLQQITTYTEWTMVDAIYYTMTLVTTIGFGHISPTTDKGKIFCILYALVGVPLTCILMARASNWLSTKMLVIFESAKKRINANQKTVLWIVTWMYVSVGFIVFMFIPSIFFSYIEDWTFVDSIYFTFITLTTIGFGDFIAGYNKSFKFSSYYKLSIVMLIMVSLGYWVMCLSFLQKAIKQNTKNLRKTFRKKTLGKHTDLIKQLLNKLKSEPEETEATTARKCHMMAILIESVMKRNNSIDYSTSYSSLKNEDSPIKPPSIKRKPNDVGGPCDNEKEEKGRMVSSASIEVSFCLDDLLNSSVALQTSNLPGIESMVSRLSYDFPPLSKLSEMPSQSTSRNYQDSLSIKLTVREVMGLALLLSSTVNGSETTETDSESSDTLTAVVVDPRENMPLLKDILHIETDQSDDISKSISPKLKKSFFLDSQSSLSGANEKVSHRQCELATG